MAEEDPADRPRQRISSSPLKRIEGEDKEIQRRNQPVHIGLRLTVMGVVVLGLFSMMLVRLWSLQVLQGPAAQRYEHNLSTRAIALAPPRGLILSRSGSVLVANQIMPVVTLNRQVAANEPAIIQRLAVALSMTTPQIDADINDQQDSIYEPVPVAVGVSDAVILELTEHRSEFPGVTVSYVAERTYPDKEIGTQMLGYVADITSKQLAVLSKDGYLPSDVIGQSGVEAQYESCLLYTSPRGDSVHCALFAWLAHQDGRDHAPRKRPRGRRSDRAAVVPCAMRPRTAGLAPIARAILRTVQ